VADQALVGQAAAQLLHTAVQDAYASRNEDLAFAVALVLDEPGRHLANLDGEVRQQVAEQCRRVID
jgi:hypothetical protein